MGTGRTEILVLSLNANDAVSSVASSSNGRHRGAPIKAAGTLPGDVTKGSLSNVRDVLSSQLLATVCANVITIVPRVFPAERWSWEDATGFISLASQGSVLQTL